VLDEHRLDLVEVAGGRVEPDPRHPDRDRVKLERLLLSLR